MLLEAMRAKGPGLAEAGPFGRAGWAFCVSDHEHWMEPLHQSGSASAQEHRLPVPLVPTRSCTP